MYLSDYNRDQTPQQPIETWDYQVHPQEPQPPTKKKRVWLKVTAMCLVCALLGGVAGGAGIWTLLGGADRGGPAVAGEEKGTTIYEGDRPAVTLSKTNQGEAMEPARIYESFVNSTVGITTEIDGGINFFGQRVQNAASGSGFIITKDGYIVTNYHVIDGASTIKVTLYNDQSFPATLVGGDEENDIAVLKIDARDLTPVVIGRSETLKVGDQVFAIGNPLGELTFSFTGGYVSALDRNVTMSDGRRMNYIQTDTAINSGNSGGALFNAYGQVVGIVTAKLSSGSSSSSASVEGLGFAIPIDNVKSMITDLIEHGYITGKPYLGIIHASVSSEAQWYGTPAGSYVLGVVEDSCADQAGLRTGDIITAIDGETVTGQDDLNNVMATHKAGDTVALTINRSGEKSTLTVTLQERTEELSKKSEELQEEIEAEQQRQYQQSQRQQSGYSYGWPFGW